MYASSVIALQSLTGSSSKRQAVSAHYFAFLRKVRSKVHNRLAQSMQVGSQVDATAEDGFRRVELETEEGKGSCFKVFIPEDPEAPDEMEV